MTDPTVVAGTFSGSSRTFAIAVTDSGDGHLVAAIRIGDSPDLVTAAEGPVRSHATARALATVTEIVENR